MCAYYSLGLSAFPKSSNREDGATDDKHAKTLSNGSNYCVTDFHLSPSYFCFRKCSLALSGFRWTKAFLDNLQY